jgi:hypothetical protein
LERQNSDVSKTANILSVSAAELMLQAKPRWSFIQEMPQILKALCSNVSLYGCECARNEPALSVVSPRCLQHCDVFVGISLEDWP